MTAFSRDWEACRMSVRGQLSTKWLTLLAGRAVAAKAGLTPAVGDVAPASAGDPSGTVEFYATIFISIGASVGQRCWAAS